MNPACCKLCGKTEGTLSDCSRCKSVTYCSSACQRQDWEDHRTLCKHKELAGAPCDMCQSTDKVIADVCIECGHLYCAPCFDQSVTHDRHGRVVGFSRCAGCQQKRRPCDAQYQKKLEKLIKKKKSDPRQSRWLVCLGKIYMRTPIHNGEQKAKDCFLRAGDLGLGQGYSRLAEIHTKHLEWDVAKQYYLKAAERMDPIAIYTLGIEASVGYFDFPDNLQESERRPPDKDKAFSLFREGTALGHPDSCAHLGYCFLKGEGTEINYAKAFKWTKRGAELGSVYGMRFLAACYLEGKGVEKSMDQCKHWLGKSLEIEFDAETAVALRSLP